MTRPSAANPSRADPAVGPAAILPIEGALALVSPAAGAGTRLASVLPSAGWSPGWFRLVRDAEQVVDALGVAHASAAHARLIRRLSPGPAIFVRDGRAAMATAHPLTVASLAEISGGLEAVEVVDERARPVTDRAEALVIGSARGIELSEGPAADVRPLGYAPATVIELTSPAAGVGVYRVLRAGAYEDRFIRKQLAMNILFVCTGNTCRSPMAEAIATALVGKGGGQPGGVELRITSAGTSAGAGAPVTAEAAAAVNELGLSPMLGAHRSRPLTRRMIAEADTIYTMSRSHLAAVLEMDPDAEGKVRTLDPDGGDVPDPIGSPQGVYTATARRIMEMIRRRFKELGT